MPQLQQTPRGGHFNEKDDNATQASDRPTMDGSSDAISWLYEQGKLAFEDKNYDEAGELFEAALDKLRKRHAREHGEDACGFDSARTNYRNLDDYLDLCRTRRSFNTRHSGGHPARDPTHGSPAPPPLAQVASTTGSLGGSDLARSSSSELLMRSPPHLARSTLIMVCSPRNSPLPHLADEAVDVANVTPSHIRRGGSAQDLRNELMRHPYEHFLFAGHGDAQLGLPTASSGAVGGPPAARSASPRRAEASRSSARSTWPRSSVATRRASAASSRRSFSTAARRSRWDRVRAAGVPYVVCWRTKAENGAARLFATSFFSSLAAGRGHVLSFEDAKSAVLVVTRPGQLANGLPSSVPSYELRDPFPPPMSPRSAAAAAQGCGDGFKPRPMAAGIPVLLCAEMEAQQQEAYDRV